MRSLFQKDHDDPDHTPSICRVRWRILDGTACGHGNVLYRLVARRHAAQREGLIIRGDHVRPFRGHFRAEGRARPPHEHRGHQSLLRPGVDVPPDRYWPALHRAYQCTAGLERERLLRHVVWLEPFRSDRRAEEHARQRRLTSLNATLTTTRGFSHRLLLAGEFF